MARKLPAGADRAYYCCNCTSPVGERAKVQPTRCDGEVWCPRCFVWKRMRMESSPLGVDAPAGEHDRFQAHQACAARCQFCDWTCVCFGSLPGQGVRCGHCGKPGAIRLRIDDETMQTLLEGIRDASREVERSQ